MVRSLYASKKVLEDSLVDIVAALGEKGVEAPESIRLEEVAPYIDMISGETEEVITGDPHAGTAKELYDGLGLIEPPLHVVFTDTKPSKEVNLVDYSKMKDMGVVKWLENDTLYVSTRREGVKIMFPETVSFMFNHFNGADIENYRTQSIDFTNADLSEVTDIGFFIYNMKYVSEIDLSGKDAPLASNGSGFIANCKNLQSINLKGMKLEKVQYGGNMFAKNPKLTELDLSGLITGSIWEFNNLFDGDTELRSIDLSNINISKTNSFDNTFKDCPNLTTIYAKEWNKSNTWSHGTDTFSGCTSLPNYDASSVNFDKAVWKENGGYFTNPAEKSG